MEQRTSEYGTIPLGAFLTAVRSITIPVEYVREDNGHWSCWTKHDVPGTIQAYGVGNTFDEAVDDYVNALKEIAECIYEDDLPEDDISVEWLAKIMMSSKEELKKCLFETSARHQSGRVQRRTQINTGGRIMTDLEIAMSRTWAEINLDELEHNIKTLRKTLNPNAKFLGVVKANAYGHGSIKCAKKLQECGADYLAVASVTEGIELRKNGINLPVLCLGQADTNMASLMCEYNITQAVGDYENGKALSDYAVSVNKKINIHVKIDTGMSRTGFYWPELNPELKARTANEILKLCRLPGLYPEGLFTHFAIADDDPEFTRSQLNRLLDAQSYMHELGIDFALSHAAASVGVLNYPEAHLNMGRFGLVLYGYASTDNGNEGSTLDLHPVMSVKSRITAVRNLPEGTTISYGRTHTLRRDSKVAVLPVGYADGLPRLLSNNFCVKIHDVKCPVLGRICMDMTMIDVTDIEGVKAGDIATVFDGELVPLAAKNSGTIIHEIVCDPSVRVPRVYINDGRMSL